MQMCADNVPFTILKRGDFYRFAVRNQVDDFIISS